MKKLVLSILTLASLSVFAQKDLSIKLLSPSNGAEINSGKAIPVAFTVKNEGPDALLATDSFRVVIYLATSSSNITPLGAFSAAKAMSMGDSANYVINNQIGVTFADDIDDALFIVAVAFKDTIANVDPNDSNDVAFTTVDLRVNHTGIAQTTALANSVSTYPNPASSVFTITMNRTNATVEVMDITGKSVEMAPITMGEARFDVSNYKNGVYFYQIKGENNTLIKSGKFTVAH
jgi:hypothetical protein